MRNQKRDELETLSFFVGGWGHCTGEKEGACQWLARVGRGARWGKRTASSAPSSKGCILRGPSAGDEGGADAQQQEAAALAKVDGKVIATFYFFFSPAPWPPSTPICFGVLARLENVWKLCRQQLQKHREKKMGKIKIAGGSRWQWMLNCMIADGFLFFGKSPSPSKMGRIMGAPGRRGPCWP